MKRLTSICRPLVILLLLGAWCRADPIAVVVNKKNRSTKLRPIDLGRIYKGKMDRWPDGQKIVLINRPVSSEIRARFYKQVLHTRPSAKYYRPGSPVPVKTMVIRSDLAALRFVSHIPNAIAYVSPDSVNDTVKVLVRLD